MTTTMTVTVGPLSCVFGNENVAMGLKLHFHTAAVWLEYDVDGEHGYPSFEVTNLALRKALRSWTAAPFANCTNEDVVGELFRRFRKFHDPSWDQYGGAYHLSGIKLDVVGVPDSIGHDDSTTTYAVRER
jgi:hypothetical protein